MAGVFRSLTNSLGWRLRCAWAAQTDGRDRNAPSRGIVPRRLLVVCYGNIIRSPYAAELLARRLSGIAVVRSAGFHAEVGRSSPPKIVDVARSAGIDLTAHRSSVATATDVAASDAIVLMDRHNWQALRKLGADPGKLIWLGAMDGGGELEDPYGRPDDEMKLVMSRLHRCAEALSLAIIARSEASGRRNSGPSR